MELIFPVVTDQGGEYTAEELLEALAAQTGGHYLLGDNTFWHGGVHFTHEQFEHCLKNQPLRAIADGVVVAYRLDEHYPVVPRLEGPGGPFKIPTSFCLARHTLRMPPANGAGAPRIFVFYSLYMHLRCHAAYLREPQMEKLPTVTITHGNLAARDKHRDHPGAMKLGVITQHAVLEVLETRNSGTLPYVRGRILSGRVLDSRGRRTAGPGDMVWVAGSAEYADSGSMMRIVKEGMEARDKPLDDPACRVAGYFTARAVVRIEETRCHDDRHEVRATLVCGAVHTRLDMPTIAAGETFWLDVKESTLEYIEADGEETAPVWPVYWKGTVTARPGKAAGLPVFAAFAGNALSDPIGVLRCSAANTFTYETRNIRTVQGRGTARRFVPCVATDNEPDYARLEPGKNKAQGFWIELGPGDIVIDRIDTDAFGSVETDPVPIRRGDPVGFPGLYEMTDHANGKTKEWLAHVEVFTPDKDFIDYLLTNPDGRSDGTRYLRLSRGTLLAETPPETPPAPEVVSVPQQGSAPSLQITLPPTEPPHIWGLQRDHVLELDRLEVRTHASGAEWLRVLVEGQDGAVRKEGAEIITRHDWAKLGFQLIEETDPDHDGFLDPDRIPEFFQALYRRINLDVEGEITDQKLIGAGRDPALRDAWSKVIARHPSEWKQNGNRVKRLHKLVVPQQGSLADKTPGLNHFSQLKIQLDKFVFWDKLNPPLPEMPYHFHPIRFVEFLSGAPVRVMELDALLDENQQPIADSAQPKLIPHRNLMAQIDPPTNRIAHRELKIFVEHGDKVTWTMEPLFIAPGAQQPSFRGRWTQAVVAHQDRFETSAIFGDSGFRRVDQTSATTTVDADGFSAIRVNLPPIGFNAARVRVKIDEEEKVYDLIDLVVPAVVVIDPGHGGIANDGGSSWNNAKSFGDANGNKTLEKTLTLLWGQQLNDRLNTLATELEPVKVVMTRTTDDNVGIAERANLAATNGADIFLSLHFNGDNNNTVYGAETAVRRQRINGNSGYITNIHHAADRAFASRIQAALDNALPRARQRGMRGYRGVKDDIDIPKTLGVLRDKFLRRNSNDNQAVSATTLNQLRNKPLPRAALVELEFITNQTVENDLISGPNVAQNRENVISAMADAIFEDIRNQE